MKNKALKRLIFGLLALPVCFSLFSFTLPSTIKKDTVVNKGFKLKTIIVDAGHGGAPSGTGHFSHGASGSFSTERGVTLAIALKLQKAIEKELNSVKVVLTRSTEDDVSWERRSEIANENRGDLFISLHCNSLSDRVVREAVGHKHGRTVYKSVRVPDRSGKGVLLLVYGLHRTREEEKAISKNQLAEGESEGAEMNAGLDPNDPESIILINQYKSKFRQRSIHLANLLNTEFTETDGRQSEGIREQGVLVLCHSAMPAVLVETGYINNPDDEEYLNSEKGQNEIVSSIVRALKNYKDEVEQVVK
ncbi:N-acetylmuramoyl-L-alanine amidase [Mucilaginibacter sp. UR6-11]|uniref:N-acetylmuramoyl-L-alanine amidase family protein n=1 Tax=Mucilaginibacter sp. UR6-11 TaxID=1435644 RepID=UPI001E3902D6|nr:N-acetylmuramoyl-L-alanine amidase [Mucilaginibacter sp. UR6-11]MCC8426977.1 N-acetylmuramoyl-L-alanine amidase [Mucilaginibacter sp. UR6-11]